MNAVIIPLSQLQSFGVHPEASGPSRSWERHWQEDPSWKKTEKLSFNHKVLEKWWYYIFIFHVFFLWYKCFWSVITQFCFKKFHLCNHPLNIMLIPNKRHPVSNWAPQTTTNWRKLVASKRLTSDSLRISPITFWGKRRAIGFYALENVMLDLVGKDLKQVKLLRNGYVSISCCHLFCFVRKYHVNIISYAKNKSHTSLFQKWRYHTKRPCSPNLHFFDSFISISSFTGHANPIIKTTPPNASTNVCSFLYSRFQEIHCDFSDHISWNPVLRTEGAMIFCFSPS